MPDSIQNIHTTPPPVQQLERIDIVTDHQAQADAELIDQALRTISAAKKQQKKEQPIKISDATPVLEEEQGVSDTVAAETDTHTVIKMERPSEQHTSAQAATASAASDYSSWVILALIVLFLLISFRFRHNFKYIKNLLHETTGSIGRRNLFADTMRETTFLTLLILLSIVSSGMILASAVSFFKTGFTPVPGEFPQDLWLYTCIFGGYFVLQWIAYLFLGNTFTSASKTAGWVQGFKAGTALMAPPLFIIAMLGVFYPSLLPILLILAFIVYFSSRILFIFKGFRIFFTHSTYFLLFLYYLCSVEIVPVLLIWQFAQSNT